MLVHRLRGLLCTGAWTLVVLQKIPSVWAIGERLTETTTITLLTPNFLRTATTATLLLTDCAQADGCMAGLYWMCVAVRVDVFVGRLHACDYAFDSARTYQAQYGAEYTGVRGEVLVSPAT